MVAGIGPTRRIYVGDTLSEGVEQDERIDETCVVLAHELGHHVHGDPWRLLALSAVTLAAGTAAGAVAVAWLVARRRRPPDDRCRLWCWASRSAPRWSRR